MREETASITSTNSAESQGHDGDSTLRPWTRQQGHSAAAPVTAIVLTRDEEANLPRCLASLGWCEEILVIDSGSTDRTVAIAQEAGARVIETEWRGFAAQREWALRQPVQTDWVYFVDADEWISTLLADEVTRVVSNPGSEVAYRQGFRLIWQGRWIRHCGWYPSAPVVRLLRPEHAAYDSSQGFSEHPLIDGKVGELASDLVDEDQKGLSRWLAKHIEYARLEADRRDSHVSVTRRPEEPWLRHLLRNRVAPAVPLRPLATFMYMYVLKSGFRDGRAGLRFCLMHAWFQLTVQALRDEGHHQCVKTSRKSQ